jgi:putative aminopeptidase FrvX
LIEATAKKKKIEFQRLASSRWTGTDTDAFAYSRGGIASALFLLPIRYMHTTVEMAHYDDVENTIQLMLESVKAIK